MNTKNNARINTAHIIAGIVTFFVIVSLTILATIFVYDKFVVKTTIETGKTLSPIDIIETFEISALDYIYSSVIFETTTSERKFLFINLKPGSHMYAITYDGVIKMGINGKDIKIDEQYNGEQTILTITVPKAYIISHDAPLNDTCSVIFDIADRMEHASIGQYIELFNEKKKETEEEIKQEGMLDRAQESAKKQLEAFLNSIPDIRDNYELRFVLE